MKCCICNEEIPVVGDWDKGNDAWPVRDGRCCNQCDLVWVVPARLGEMRGRVACINTTARHGTEEDEA